MSNRFSTLRQRNTDEDAAQAPLNAVPELAQLRT